MRRPGGNTGRIRLWATLAGVVAVTVVTIIATGLIVARSDRQVKVANSVIALEAQANRLSTLEWQAVAERHVAPESNAEVKRTLAEMQHELDGIQGEARDSREVQGLTVAFDRYRVALREEFALLSANRWRSAREVDEAQVDPAFARLLPAVRRTAGNYSQAATASRTPGAADGGGGDRVGRCRHRPALRAHRAHAAAARRRPGREGEPSRARALLREPAAQLLGRGARRGRRRQDPVGHRADRRHGRLDSGRPARPGPERAGGGRGSCVDLVGPRSTAAARRPGSCSCAIRTGRCGTSKCSSTTAATTPPSTGSSSTSETSASAWPWRTGCAISPSTTRSPGCPTARCSKSGSSTR